MQFKHAKQSRGVLVSPPPGTSGLDAGAAGPGVGQGGTWGEPAAAGGAYSPTPDPATPTAPPAVVDDSSDVPNEQVNTQGFEGHRSEQAVAGQVSCTGHLHANITWYTAHECETGPSMEA